jgi:hydrogenase nickel incorporation protein HypA/HybF
MHEYSVVSELIAQVEAQARKNGADRVHRVIVRLGERAGVERGLFETAFNTFRERTICERAELVIEAVSARWACPKCAAEIARGAALSCARCRVPASLVEGAELLLQTIEMEVGDV